MIGLPNVDFRNFKLRQGVLKSDVIRIDLEQEQHTIEKLKNQLHNAKTRELELRLLYNIQRDKEIAASRAHDITSFGKKGR